MHVFSRANRALFEGNREEVRTLLQNEAHSGRALWLLASAAETEDERMLLLARVHATHEQPYADMALDILERERYFAREIARVPAWQSFLQRRRQFLMRSVIAIVFVVLICWIGSLFIFPAPPVAENLSSSDSGSQNIAPDSAAPLPATAVPTPNVTLLPYGQSANYMPLGALRLLNVEFPAQLAVTDGTSAVTPVPGSVYLALRYEFTCGTAQAFCERLPEAQLFLELADSSLGLIPASELQVQGTGTSERIASGSSVQQWIVFEVPQSQSPRQLVIAVDSDQDNEADTRLTLDLPR